MAKAPAKNETSSALDKTFSDFLNHPEKKVLVLKGKWGVGKTFAWKKFIEARKEFEESAVAYVSLFGVKDLREVQQLIVQKAVPTNLKQLRNISKVGIPLVNALRNLPVPYLKDALEASDNIAALLVRKFLICFDDIERKSDELPLAAILGLVSVLKEEKECRVVLIFNDGQIEDEKDKISLKKYREKVIDQEVTYNPPVKNNVQVIFQPNEFPRVQEVLQRLGINNIRIIKFSYWNAKYFESFTVSLQKAVRDSFMENVTILTCVFFMHGDEIDVNNLPQNYLLLMVRKKAEEKLTDVELFLQQAEYSKSEYDALIIDFLKNGDIDVVELKKILSSLNQREMKSQTQQKLHSLWWRFSSNFQVKMDEVLDSFTAFVKEHERELNYGEIKQVCDLFTALGHDDISQKLQAGYIENNLSTTTLEGVEMFKQKTSNPETLRKLSEREREIKKEITLQSVVYRLADKQAWNPKDEIFLDSFSEDNYYQWFETESDEDFLDKLREFYRTYIKSADNAIWRSIGGKFEGALKRLSKRNELDRYRIQLFFNLKE